MASKPISYVYVTIQFACLGFLLLTGPVIAADIGFLIIEFLGGILGVWAIYTMRIRNVHPLPDVRENAVLVERGPYRLIRHPMYSSLLVMTLALIFEHFTLVRAGIWFLFLINFLFKLRYEERLLSAHFPEYPAYMRRTKRLIPYLY